jgi:hypothetical protein
VGDILIVYNAFYLGFNRDSDSIIIVDIDDEGQWQLIDRCKKQGYIEQLQKEIVNCGNKK